MPHHNHSTALTLLIIISLSLLFLGIYQIIQVFRTSWAFDSNDCDSARQNFEPVYYITITFLILGVLQQISALSLRRSMLVEPASKMQ